jgi:hypothetical protein
MKEFDPATEVSNSSVAQLSQLLDLADQLDEWKEQDLPSMLLHQFSAPIDSDLRRQELASGASQSREKTLTGAASIQIVTFRDLFNQPDPSLELLKLAKEFFKWRTRALRKDSPEWRVAYLFYLLTLLAAGKNASLMSSLSPKALLQGVKWALEQSWIDPQTRKFILTACERLILPTDASRPGQGQ